MDIWSASLSWLLGIVLLWTLGCMHLSRVRFSRDACPGVGLLEHMVVFVFKEPPYHFPLWLHRSTFGRGALFIRGGLSWHQKNLGLHLEPRPLPRQVTVALGPRVLPHETAGSAATPCLAVSILRREIALQVWAEPRKLHLNMRKPVPAERNKNERKVTLFDRVPEFYSRTEKYRLKQGVAEQSLAVRGTDLPFKPETGYLFEQELAQVSFHPHWSIFYVAKNFMAIKSCKEENLLRLSVAQDAQASPALRMARLQKHFESRWSSESTEIVPAPRPGTQKHHFWVSSHHRGLCARQKTWTRMFETALSKCPSKINQTSE